MKNKYLILILCLFIFTTPVNAAGTASSQFKSFDKRGNTEDGSVDYKYHAQETYKKTTGEGKFEDSFLGRTGKTTFDQGIDAGIGYGEKAMQNASREYAAKVRKYVSDNMPAQSQYRNFNDYRNAVNNMRNAERQSVAKAEKQAANTSKMLKSAGKLYQGGQLINDFTHLNDESRHRHSSLKQLALTTRYMKFLYGAGSLGNKGLEGAATASSYLNDAVESDEFIDWANEQDNEFLDFLDDITDKINDKAYKDACQILEWLGINPPTNLPALRTAIKPNIYLYPEKTSDISVIFDSPELLLTVIPDYNGGWYATVDSEGNMFVDGEKYWYLFYESMTSDYLMQTEKGFIVPVKERKEFFTYIANYYGFNEQETNDFVTFWCSRLESDKEYVMYPQLTATIDILMPVQVSPKPDNIFRVWFLFYENNDKDMELKQPEQILASRDGYEMVEWGGIVAE